MPGEDGQNAVILQLYSEDGGTVAVGKSTTIKTLLTSGTDSVTPTSVKWYKFDSTASPAGYVQILGQTGTSITITEDMVTDQMWLKCEAVYDGKTYSAYQTIDDITDPYTAYTFATVQQFKNSQGCGAIYTIVYQNGVEVDPIKSTTFSTNPNLAGSSGDYYYYLDTTQKTCILKKHNGTTWVTVNVTDEDEPDYEQPYSFTYKYFRLDKNGIPMDTVTPYTTQRCFYIDPTIIQGRTQFICEVSN